MAPRLIEKPHAIIAQIPCLSDNYGWLIHDRENGTTAAIDTPDADAINQVLEAQGWDLTLILNTHWHMDHTGGNLALKDKWGCTIIGPAAEGEKLPGLDRPVQEADQIALGAISAVVIETPGHTLGHCVYYFADCAAAFVGDSLFSLGCGRVFEGTHEQMWHSLLRLRALPDETEIYCAHEYSLGNGRFALSIDPDNRTLQKRMADIEALRADDLPTIPTKLAIEKAANPFLRADDGILQKTLSMKGQSAETVFAHIRQSKDRF